MESTVVKSANDQSSYKAFTLENGLKVLLISDYKESEDSDTESVGGNEQELPEGEDVEEGVEVMETGEDSAEEKDANFGKKKNMSAVALSVGIGSFSDPPELPGLAHFLEHMVFMGSKKYPRENAYDDFIKTHGGEDNAFTSSERTVFIMTVVAKHFYQSLDIFAHCLVEPLLRSDSMEREIKAVDSEFSLATPSDNNRLYLLRQTMAKEGHPLSKFPWGNVKSLKTDPEDKNIDLNAAVKEFYNRYYSSDYMTLTVQSTATLETLETWVREIFSPIKNNNIPLPVFEATLEPFKIDEFHKLYKVIPVKDTHELCLSWIMPPTTKLYRSKPLAYLAFIINDESKGSILSWLRKKSYAVSLSASDCFQDEDVSICSLFKISITLSDKGMDSIFEVCTAVFRYIQMILKEAPQKYLFDDIQLIAETEFRFEEKEEPFENVAALANNMHVYPPEHYLTGGKLFYDYDEKAIKEFMDCLEIPKANIIILSSRYSIDTMTWKEEPWTKCNYLCEDLPPEWIERWSTPEDSPQFHLPEPNKFIATSFDLIHKESENKYPYKIINNEKGCLWFKEDTTFKVPKAYIYLCFVSSNFTSSQLNYTMLELFITILKQKLPDYVYPAEVASLEFALELHKRGFILRVYGFNEKLLTMLETILEVLCNLDVEEELFENLKRHQRNIFNNQILKPGKLSGTLQSLILQNLYWSLVDKFQVIDSISLEQFTAFLKSSFSELYIEGLIQGNISKKDALTVFDMVHTKMQLIAPSPKDLPQIRTIEMPIGQSICRVASMNCKDNNSVISNLYQICAKNVENLCLVDLLVWNMSERCFDNLRTKQQLGYYVICSLVDVKAVLGFNIMLKFQSNKFSCDHVDGCIENFIKEFIEEMNAVTDEMFLTQLNSLIEKKKVDFLNLKEEVDTNWSYILCNEYTFDMKEQQIKYLQSITKEQYLKYWNDKLFNIAESGRKLCIQVVGPDEPLTGDETANMDVGDSNLVDRRNLRFIGKPSEVMSAIKDIRAFKSSLPYFLDDANN